MTAKKALAEKAMDAADDDATMTPLDIPGFSVPLPLFVHEAEDKVLSALKRLRKVPDEIMSGIPEEVRAATVIPEKRINVYAVFRPAVWHIYAWWICSIAAHNFPTIKEVRQSGRLSENDCQILEAAHDRYIRAGGDFSEKIKYTETKETRRALSNVNRAIEGRPARTSEMVEQHNEARKAAAAAQRQKAGDKKPPTQP